MKNIISDACEILQGMCKLNNQWGMYITFSPDEEGILEAAPYLKGEECYEILFNGAGYILVDTKEELEKLYCQTVGKDGPTKANPYQGDARVYAITCNPSGQLLTENS